MNTNTDTWTAVRVSPNSKTLNVEGEDSTQVEITGLTKNTYYQVKVKAMNRIGSSDEATFIFKTGAGGECCGLFFLFCVRSCTKAVMAG